MRNTRECPGMGTTAGKQESHNFDLRNRNSIQPQRYADR
jgi:hypothetical protein